MEYVTNYIENLKDRNNNFRGYVSLSGDTLEKRVGAREGTKEKTHQNTENTLFLEVKEEFSYYIHDLEKN